MAGEDASAEGMDLVPGTDKVKNGAEQINKSRDYIAQFFNAAKAYADSLFGSISLAWDAITGKPATFPPSAHTHSSLTGSGVSFGTNGNIGGAAGFWSNARLGCADRLYVSDHAFFTSLSAATSSYTVAYINGDGRLSKGASSVRFKKFISDVNPIALGNLFPSFKRFQMRSGDGVWRYGYTAEDIAANPDTEQFAVYERVIEEDGTAAHLKRDAAGNPIPESIDFIGLLLAQVAQLNARIEELEAGR